MKKIIKVSLFLIIFAFIWEYIFSFLWLEENSIGQFYKEPKDSLDVLYFGSSNAYVHFNTVLAFHKFGFTTGMLASDTEPLQSIKYLIEEGQKSQKNISVYVIDISTFPRIEFSEGVIRKVIDSVPLSTNKIALTHELLTHTNIPKEKYINYYLSFLTYHNMWKNINIENFKSTKYFKGSKMFLETTYSSPMNYTKWLEKSQDIPLEIKNDLIQLLDYIKNKKINVEFIISPRVYNEEQMMMLNTITEICNSYNFHVLNLYNTEDLNIDYNKDFFDSQHLNTTGTIKFTKYLGNYLVSNYNLQDHRNDDKYKSWHNTYDFYSNTYEELTNNNYESILEKIW